MYTMLKLLCTLKHIEVRSLIEFEEQLAVVLWSDNCFRFILIWDLIALRESLVYKLLGQLPHETWCSKSVSILFGDNEGPDTPAFSHSILRNFIAYLDNQGILYKFP